MKWFLSFQGFEMNDKLEHYFFKNVFVLLYCFAYVFESPFGGYTLFVSFTSFAKWIGCIY